MAGKKLESLVPRNEHVTNVETFVLRMGSNMAEVRIPAASHSRRASQCYRTDDKPQSPVLPDQGETAIWAGRSGSIAGINPSRTLAFTARGTVPFGAVQAERGTSPSGGGSSFGEARPKAGGGKLSGRSQAVPMGGGSCLQQPFANRWTLRTPTVSTTG